MKTLTPTDMKIMVVGDRVWGKGDTLALALEKAGKPKAYVAYVCHPDTKMCDDGSVTMPSPDMRPKLIIVKKPKKPKARKQRV